MAAKYKSRYKPGEESKYRDNKKRLLSMSDDICAICGGYVDKTLLYPHPMSATADHIVPLSKGGTSDLSNLQLAHWICNRLKSDKLCVPVVAVRKKKTSPRELPHMLDWTRYRASE